MTTAHDTGPGESSRAVRIDIVQSRRDLRAFLELPWRIYRDDPNWVAPLLVEQRKLLDRKKHPFHRHAEVEYFLARREGTPVGRIAAVVNRRHNEFHDDRVGFFGFFECENDQEAADALFDAAAAWLRERGLDSLRGPTNFSTNEECGLLVEGFDRPPTIMMTHHRPYYAALLEGHGFRKAKDLLAYMLWSNVVPDRLARGVERIASRNRVAVRSVDMKRFPAEVQIIQRIYNSAWERNWGFVPMTDAEFAHLAADLKRIVDPHLCLIAEIDGEPVAFALSLPDLNQALHHINGRLLPLGLLKLLWYSRSIDQARVITLGVRPGYRKLGLDALLYKRTFDVAQERGILRGECSWILEDNWAMRRGLEHMGAEIYKTYRIYEKPL